MRITILTVPDCPHAALARERIEQALHGRAAMVEFVEVADETQAARHGMTGSPTVLIDGSDPFAVPGAVPSLSCRLYRAPDGRTEGHRAWPTCGGPCMSRRPTKTATAHPWTRRDEVAAAVSHPARPSRRPIDLPVVGHRRRPRHIHYVPPRQAHARRRASVREGRTTTHHSDHRIRRGGATVTVNQITVHQSPPRSNRAN